MLSGAAHEINNPLSGVIGNVQLLLAEESLGREPRSRLERVHRESQRIAALVRNLLRIAHRDVGPRAILDVNGLIQDTVALRQHDFAGAGIRLDLDLATERMRVFGNELELQQVFLNLFLNARDAMPSGGWLSVTTRVEAGRVIAEVADTGSGIPSEQIARIYDPFFTTKAIGRGTGLGLSITYGIVREHDGTILCDSAVGQGTRFTMELPLAPAVARSARAN